MHEYTVRELLTQYRGVGGKPEVFGQGSTALIQYIINLIKTKELNNLRKYFRVNRSCIIYYSSSFVHDETSQFLSGFFLISSTFNIRSSMNLFVVDDIQRDWKTRFHRVSTLRNFKEISRPFNSNNGFWEKVSILDFEKNYRKRNSKMIHIKE
ncbi:hypothetical protein ALC53_03592 [Atta colombica]|uniref:Uncharacterized protein n=1 Tax=Atta colombica TaxID=520822 RepID=A0A151I590_9HYME|nr:hypothetical protein ALC53_03592 [Atta colombica]